MKTAPISTVVRGRSSRRRRLPWILLLLVFAGAGVATFFILLPGYEARRERTLGLLAAADGRFDEAKPLLCRASKRNPDDLEVVQALARGQLAAGPPPEAEEWLDRWCALRPDDPLPFKLRMAVRHNRARAAPPADEKQRRMEEVLADGRRVLRLDPGDDGVAQEVVWLLTRVGRYDEADLLCRRCLDRQPNDLWLTYLLAKIAHARGAGAGDEARTLLDGLLRQFPQCMPALLLRATLYNEAGEPDKAVPLLRQVLSSAPDDRQEARYQLSLALARTGQADEAARLMAELQKDNLEMLLASPHDSDTPGLKLQLAETCLAADHEAEARRLLEPLLEQEPGASAAHALLAAYYERKGQPGRAEEHRRRATRE